ncbi:hypothetical protein QN277_019210 [Acacia crassicarpa]|uniref:Uncharacterized protein n=1 Tax=Acacia crassicarpa TaxID=499986 RepID=A0AAE1JW51_9FABA|nr:hypothetical protein QN277_019210 [Acacia crassicarpa]
MAFFAKEGFNRVPLLEGSHLRGLVKMECPYSKVMVRAFYHNLSYINGDLKYHVCSVDILMTAPIWMELLGYDFYVAPTVEYDGDSNAPIVGFVQAEAVNKARRLGGHRVIFTVGQLTIDAHKCFFFVRTTK